MADPEFRADLYRGAARSYDAYRLPYPRDLIDDLAARSGADGTGRLLDLACGTGQVAFALRDRFAQIWAVDQEPDMIELSPGRRRQPARSPRCCCYTCRPRSCRRRPTAFDLVTIGNAFHRLRRQSVADRVLALAAAGRIPRAAVGRIPGRWRRTVAANAAGDHAVVAGRERGRSATPARLSGGPRGDAGHRDPALRPGSRSPDASSSPTRATGRWTRSPATSPRPSVLSAAALGAAALAVRRRPAPRTRQPRAGGRFRQDATFAYDLARRP